MPFEAFTMIRQATRYARLSRPSISTAYMNKSKSFIHYLPKHYLSSGAGIVGNNNDDDLKGSGDIIDVPGVRSSGDKMILVYTCKVCESRSAKKITKHAYTHGCVVVRCGGCDNLHLIADRKGLFEDGNWDIKQYLESHGESVTVVTDDTGVLELTQKEILGGVIEVDVTPSTDDDVKKL